MRFLIPLLTFTTLIMFSCSQPQDSSTELPIEKSQGKDLFVANCSQCHRPDQNFVGPALKGVEKRWTDQRKLYSFIRNSQEVIERDAYAKALYEKWGRAYMQPFTDLKDEEIKAILVYCNQN